MEFYKLFTFENQSQFEVQDKMQRGKKNELHIYTPQINWIKTL